ncbi:M28 family peptidase [Candidatus Poribacteria bacterium]|nr:M28 family peptidase [Candidatus Poribacteria bacterium]MYG07330.1 M28 family peptidase [Candidatus Poribacteria bacterium]MYK22025.1 M28 family peptidase [Candidatus Poribacteria bacterium]
MRCIKLIGLFCTIFFAIFITGDVVAQQTTADGTETNTPPESRFLSNSRQLTYDGKRAGEGYFSEDGNALIFQSEREPDNPFYQIYLLNLLTGDTHRVSTGIGKTTCAFFRPGTDEVLYASTHHDAFAKAKQEEELQFRASGQERRYSWDYDAAMDIFSAHRDGSNLKRLTDAPGYDAEASYSPDGKRIVFCSLRDAYPKDQLAPKALKQLEVDPAYFGEIYIMNADGSDQTRLTNSPGYDGGPFFTPDGRHIVWRHFTPDGSQADIYTMQIDGSNVRRLTDFKSMSWAPYFHPSGAYVIFASNKLGFSNFELYLVDGRGRHEPVRVTSTDGFDGLPVFSPDGNRLCWTSNRNSQGVSQLYLADWNHQAALEAISLAPRSHNAPIPVFNSQAQDGTHVHTSPTTTKISIQQRVEFLASDELQGRMTGTEGAKRAAEHIATQFSQLRLNPIGDEASYFQAFEFTAGRRIIAEENRFHITRQMHSSEQVMEFSVERDFQPLSFSRNGVVEGEVVFVGYGLTVPGELGEGYDAYAGLDVKDKIVVALRYVPEGVEPERRQQLNRYAGLRYKAMQAREQGAQAFFVVAGPNSPNTGKLIPLDFDSSLADSGIVAASISDTVANALFAPSGKNLKDVQSGLDTENPHFLGQFPLPGVKVKIVVSVEKVKKTDQNVVALLPPPELTDDTEYVIVGAHYDHIGHGEIGSLARKGEEGQIHNGADDNASGTAVVLELATTLSEAYQKYPEKFRRGIIFALWSGEELGLIGSTHFVNDPIIPLKKVAAYVNFDMVGRLRENKLILQGVGSSAVWTKLIEKRNIPIGFNLTLQEDPYLPTDVTAFYPKEVPVLSFFTGGHEDYNRPTDDAETLNFSGIARISDFAHGIVLDLVSADERPEYVRVERSQSEEGSRDTLRAYLGTIPDYTTEGTGVKLSGVRAGGPADKAGLEGGDVIVEFGGQEITNIYDYTYALDAVKIGEPVEVVVLREGKRVKLTVTPEARN